MDKEILYCSLDVEATGFDPLTEEILELGFIVFGIGEGGEIVEKQRFEKVYKASRPVSEHILGLTGLDINEINNAEPFSLDCEFVSEILDGKVLVGHNIGIDLTFLRNSGVKFEGAVLDTLDLVQIVMPTYHSYNLENLAHSFHLTTKSHRALADAESSMQLMHICAQIWRSLKPNTQDKLNSLMKFVDTSFASVWQYYLSKIVKAQPLVEFLRTEHLNLDLELDTSVVNSKYVFEKKFVNVLEAQGDKSLLESACEAALCFNEKSLLVVEDSFTALSLWKMGFARALVNPELCFDAKKFNTLLGEDVRNPLLAKFLAKILVWLETNWQTESIVDLNVSFSGAQFRDLVTTKRDLVFDDKILVADVGTAAYYMGNVKYRDRAVVVSNVMSFDEQLKKVMGGQVSWSGATKILSNFILSLGEYPDSKLKESAEEAMVSIDLFFGLMRGLMLKQSRDTDVFSWSQIESLTF